MECTVPETEDGLKVDFPRLGAFHGLIRERPDVCYKSAAQRAPSRGPHPNSMLEARSLVRRYGDFTAVGDVSFTVQEGEILGMLGPNGAGKTTTLRMLTGYLRPTEGSVWIDGRDIATEPIRSRSQIGYLPENVALYTEMRVEEYLAYRGRLERM